eukprot:Clim_evm23s207 gene=Clim_evmTU23s207
MVSVSNRSLVSLTSGPALEKNTRYGSIAQSYTHVATESHSEIGAWAKLGGDVVMYILSFVASAEDLLEMAQTSRVLNYICREPELWYQLCKRSHCPQLVKKEHDVDWRLMVIALSTKMPKTLLTLSPSVMFPISTGRVYADMHSSKRLMNVAMKLRDFGYYEKSEYVFHRALEAAIEEFGPQSEAVGDAVYFVSLSKGNQGKNIGLTGTRELRRLAIDIYQRVIGELNAKVALAIYSLADVYFVEGNYEKAEPLYWKALNLRLEVCPEDEEVLAESYSGLGLIYDAKRDYDHAEEYYRKSLEMRERTLGKDHPKVARVCVNLGAMYKSKGMLDKTIELYERALAIRQKHLGTSHPYTKRIYVILNDTKRRFTVQQETLRQQRMQEEDENRVQQARMEMMRQEALSSGHQQEDDVDDDHAAATATEDSSADSLQIHTSRSQSQYVGPTSSEPLDSSVVGASFSVGDVTRIG